MTFRRTATLFLLTAIAVPTVALAAPFKVNSTDDTAGQDCTNPANTCTLRGAIAQAAALGAAQEIDLPGVPNTGDVTTYTVGSTLATITNNDITVVGNSQGDHDHQVERRDDLQPDGGQPHPLARGNHWRLVG